MLSNRLPGVLGMMPNQPVHQTPKSAAPVNFLFGNGNNYKEIPNGIKEEVMESVYIETTIIVAGKTGEAQAVLI